MNRIDKFNGEYDFLSNFYFSKIKYEGKTYKSVEHAFQAAKTNSATHKQWVQEAHSAREAKRRGKQIPLREDWEKVKLNIMLEICRIKFKDPYLQKLLSDTGDLELIEGNTWNDTFWGVCNGKGQNNLGKILMQVRDELKNSTSKRHSE